ncbi:MAG: low molecular weight phosphotyrosine protein phosphatase [Betaproteobacteria bacterium]|nr:low molecular weight phosphotyrosine protein phosphatase [Betaproteobacteria bacterium]
MFICTANICRSPTAEGVLKKLLVTRGVASRFQVDSAGTHDYHVGKPPFPLAVERAKLRGYDLTHIVSRKVTGDDFEHFDLILGMGREHISSLRQIAPTRLKQKIELFLDYGDSYHGQDIPDPYGGQARDFDLVLDMVEDGCNGLAGLMVR